MAKYKYIGDEPRHVNTGDRLVAVEPGDIVDIADSLYVQTGQTGEPALFEAHQPTPKKAAKPQKESE